MSGVFGVTGRRAAAVLVGAFLVIGVVPAHAGTDPTITRKAKVSQAHRQTIGFRTWRASSHGHSISWRESHDVCSAVNPSGAYRGKWQMTRSLWRSYGGRQYARLPDRATCRQQDVVARRIWVDQWWWPWGG